MKRRGLKFVLYWILLLLMSAAAVMLLWNLLLPAIFGLPIINLWQAFGLFLLARLLFGGLGFGKILMMGMFGHRNNPFREKWMNMTPEQREKFIHNRQKFGFHGHHYHDDFFMGSKMNENEGGQPDKED